MNPYPGLIRSLSLIAGCLIAPLAAYGSADSCSCSLKAPPIERVQLALNDAIRMTLMNEDQIELLRLAIDAQRGTALQSESPFDTYLDGVLARTQIYDSQNVSYGFKSHEHARDSIAGLRVHRTTRIGTAFSFALSAEQAKNRTNPLVDFSEFGTTTNINFRIDQPLLRNFLYGLNYANEKAAYLELYAVQYDTMQDIAQVILEAILRYWDVVAAQRNLDVQWEAEHRLERLLENTRTLIAKDELAKADIYQPQATLARQKIDRLNAQQALYTAVQSLEVFIGDVASWPFPRNQPDAVDRFPKIPKNLENMDSGFVELVDIAKGSRPDLLAALTRIEENEVLLVGACNSNLPELNVYGEAHTSDFRMGRHATSLGKAFHLTRPEKDITIGVTLNTPVYNSQAMGLIQKQRALLSQSQLFSLRLTDEITAAVRSAFADHLTLVDASRQARKEVQANKLLVKSEYKKLQAGSSTLFELIAYENRLTESRSRYIVIQRAYAQSLAKLRFLTGTLIAAEDSDLCCISVQSVLELPVERGDS